jgi:hypothetical protein
MRKRLRKRQFEKGLRVDDTRANIREGENTNQKTPHNITVLAYWRGDN